MESALSMESGWTVKSDNWGCNACGKKNRNKTKECTAANIVCPVFNRQGHFKQYCFFNQDTQDGTVKANIVSLNSASLEGLATVKVTLINPTNRLDLPWSALCDTGCSTSLCGINMAPDHLIDVSDKNTIVAVGNSTLNFSESATVWLIMMEARSRLSSNSTRIWRTRCSYRSRSWTYFSRVISKDDAKGHRYSRQLGHVERVGGWLYQRGCQSSIYILSKYGSVFDDSSLKPMIGSPAQIYLRDDIEIKPLYLTHSRQIPSAYEAGAMEALEEAEKNGIIELVNEPMNWSAPCHFRP